MAENGSKPHCSLGPRDLGGPRNGSFWTLKMTLFGSFLDPLGGSQGVQNDPFWGPFLTLFEPFWPFPALNATKS